MLFVLKSLSYVWLFATLWTADHQAPLSMGFSRQEHWSGLPFPPPGDLRTQGSNLCLPASPALRGDSLPAEPPQSLHICEFFSFLLIVNFYFHSTVTGGKRHDMISIFFNALWLELSLRKFYMDLRRMSILLHLNWPYTSINISLLSGWSIHWCKWSFKVPLVAQMVKNMPAMQETQVWSLGWEDPLEKEMATHSSNLDWGIPWTEEPGGLQSMGSHRADTTEHAHTFCYHDIILDLFSGVLPQSPARLCAPPYWTLAPKGESSGAFIEDTGDRRVGGNPGFPL